MHDSLTNFLLDSQLYENPRKKTLLTEITGKIRLMNFSVRKNSGCKFLKTRVMNFSVNKNSECKFLRQKIMESLIS